MACGNTIAVNASLKDFETSFSEVIAVEGCKEACATKLLNSMGLKASKTLYLSDKYRRDEKVGLTWEDDLAIEKRVPEVAKQILELASENITDKV